MKLAIFFPDSAFVGDAVLDNFATVISTVFSIKRSFLNIGVSFRTYSALAEACINRIGEQTRNLWKEEQDFLFECFIQKHRIFTSNDEEKNGEGKKLTMAEKIRMNAAMKAMQDKSMTQRIEG